LIGAQNAFFGEEGPLPGDDSLLPARLTSNSGQPCDLSFKQRSKGTEAQVWTLYSQHLPSVSLEQQLTGGR
jgi:hypothetical protein